MTGSAPNGEPQAMTLEEAFAYVGRKNKVTFYAQGGTREGQVAVLPTTGPGWMAINGDGKLKECGFDEWPAAFTFALGVPVTKRDDTAELVEALEAIAAGAPTERPDWYEGDNGTDIALNAAHIEHFRVAEIARAALAKRKERS